MQPKPTCYGEHNASAFQEQSVARAYQHRPSYPPETFERLLRLGDRPPRRVLDLGCGTGALARQLVQQVEQVDAVDSSRAMIEQGQRLPGGDHPRLRWLHGPAEQVELDRAYDLAVAGESLHWMDWELVLPRLRELLAPDGYLVVLELDYLRVPWSDGLGTLIRRYSTVQDYQGMDTVAELERRGLFSVKGRHRTAPVPLVQSIDDYIESFHGRASLSRERMRPEDAAAFDAALRHVIVESGQQQVLLPVVAESTWGRP